MEKREMGEIEKLKIAIIYGKREVDGLNKNGVIEKIYKDEDDTAHCFYLKEFLEQNLKSEKEIQASAMTRDSNSIFFELQKLGHIGFAESTSKKAYKEGIFYMPKTITEKQKDTLKQFKNQLDKEDYNIMIFANLYRDKDGVIMGKIKQGKANILDDYTRQEIER